MSEVNRTVLACAGGDCFPLITGRIINSDRLPEDFKVCHVLRCRDGALFRRRKDDRGRPGWERLNVPPGGRFVFVDPECDQVCLMGFSSGIGGGCPIPVRPINPTPGQPVQPVPITPAQIPGGQGNVRPAVPGGGVITPLQAALLLGASAPGSTTSGLTTGSTVPFSAQSQTGLFGQTTARLVASGAVSTTGSIPPTGAGVMTTAGAGTGDDLIFGAVDNGTIAVIQDTGDPTGPTAGATASGFASGLSQILSANNGATSRGNAQDRSTIFASQDGATAKGDATIGSLIQAAAPGSSAIGTANRFSQVRAGGQPIFRDLPPQSKVIMLQSPGLTRTDRVDTIDFLQATNTGCELRSVRVNNINNPEVGILGLFSSNFHFGPFVGPLAAGSGDGAVAAGMADSDAHVLATASGSVAQGTAECGRVHLAAGKGSTVFGSSNIALAPQSMALGTRSFGYMAGSIAHSSFDTPVNVAMAADCIGACQRITVMTKGSTICIRDPPVGVQTGFILTTNFVLADSPDNPLIIQPNGGQIDISRVPFLHCPGTAIVEATLVSPPLIGDRNQNLGPALSAQYIFTVSRTDLNNQSTHDISNLSRIYANPNDIDNFITVEAVNNEGFNEGFTLQIQDLVPLDINGTPNPRLRFNAAGNPVNPIMGRSWCVYFTITFIASGFTELNCIENPLLLGATQAELLAAGEIGTGTGCRQCARRTTSRDRSCFCEDKGFTPQAPVGFGVSVQSFPGTSLI